MSSTVRLTSVVVAGMILCVTPRPCGADVDEDFQDLVASAHADYLVGEYTKAATTLGRAYALKPLPKLLYNIARAHEKAGQVPEAIDHYRRFLDKPGDQASLVLKAKAALDALEGPKEGDDEVPSAQPAAAPAAAPVASYVLLGIASAGLGATTFFAWSAMADAAEFDTTEILEDRQDLAASAATHAHVADLAAAVTIACAVGAFLALPSASDGSTDEPEASWMPVLTPTRAGALIGMRWTR